MGREAARRIWGDARVARPSGTSTGTVARGAEAAEAARARNAIELLRLMLPDQVIT
jgi:hypothetical protein